MAESIVILDELGVEPYGYIGYSNEHENAEGIDAIHRVFHRPIKLIKVGDSRFKDAIHKILSESVALKIISGESLTTNSFHRIYSTTMGVKVSVPIYSAIHKHTVGDKINAPVDFTCDTYLDTPYESRILETPLKIC